MDETLKTLGIDTNGVRYDQMNDQELATVHEWIRQLETEALTINGVLDSIRRMIVSVQQKLIDTPETEKVWLFFERPNRDAVMLKARLQNYLFLEALLTSPERAKKMMSQKLKSI